VRRRPNIRRTLTILALALAAHLALAPAAVAGDGEGWLGRPDDLTITLFGYGVIAFFIVVPIVFSLLQAKLDSRKDRRKRELARLDRR
jgi:hypothetical protein